VEDDFSHGVRDVQTPSGFPTLEDDFSHGV